MPFALLLSPLGSDFDIWESAIMYIYAQKALKNVLPSQNYYLLNLITDTPWLLYQYYSLFNLALVILDPTDNMGSQTVVLILALNAVCCAHVANSDFILFNRNGPVPNEGYGVLTSLGAALGKKIAWIGDDARHLYGNSDNPMLVGIGPSVSNKLFNPQTLVNRLNYYDPKAVGNCGAPTMDKILLDAIEDAPKTPPVVQLAPSTTNAIALGNLLNSAFGPSTTPGNITWNDCLLRPKDVYLKIKSVINMHPELISNRDRDYLKENSSSLFPNQTPSASFSDNNYEFPAFSANFGGRNSMIQPPQMSIKTLDLFRNLKTL
jgi:hypothetical protein